MTPSRTQLTGASLLVLVLALTGCTNVEEQPSSVQSGSSVSPNPSASPTPTSSDGTQSDSSAGSGQSGDSNSDDSESGDSGDSGSSDSARPQPDAGGASTPAPPPPSTTPAVALTQQKCLSGKLTITLTASSSSDYRKGIAAVTLERQNEYNAWISNDATWLGPETGQGNQWTGNLPGNTQNIGKTLRVTATSSSGTTTTISASVTAPC